MAEETLKISKACSEEERANAGSCHVSCWAHLAPAPVGFSSIERSPKMKSPSLDPEAVVQRQLEAYNAHDVDAIAATYAED